MTPSCGLVTMAWATVRLKKDNEDEDEGDDDGGSNKCPQLSSYLYSLTMTCLPCMCLKCLPCMGFRLRGGDDKRDKNSAKLCFK